MEGCAIPMNNSAYAAFTSARSELSMAWCEDPNWELECAGDQAQCAGVVPRCLAGRCALITEAEAQTEAVTLCDAGLCPTESSSHCRDAGINDAGCSFLDGSAACSDAAGCGPPSLLDSGPQPDCADAGDGAPCP